MQIRTRLTIWFIAITALLLGSSLVFIYINFSNHLRAEFYKTLESKALMTVAMLVKNNPSLERIQDGVTSENALPSKENIIVFDTSFTKLFAFNEGDEISIDKLQSIMQNKEVYFNIGNYQAVGIRYTTTFGKDLIVISKGIFLSDELLRLSNIMILTFFIFLTFTAISGYYFANRALLPITKTMNELDGILPSDLSHRVNVSKTKDELARLSITFNKLLDRLEEAFNIQKGFLSNISHELRNPLASIISTLQVNLSKDRSIDEYKQCMHSVLEDAVELEHTSSHLMSLARLSSKSDKILFGKLRIDELVWQSKAIVRKSNQGYAFKFDSVGLPDDQNKLIINGNEALLKTAFINLFENACKFSPDHTALLKLSLVNDNEMALEIIDTANTIPEEEKERIFKPFYRSNSTKIIKGSGIGLSLVASILKVHDARLEIKSNDGTIGNTFIVYFRTSP